MFGLAGLVSAPEGRCLSLAGLLCLKVMGLETDEENELFSPKHVGNENGRKT